MISVFLLSVPKKWGKAVAFSYDLNAYYEAKVEV